ncbi:hypothetical protein [Buchananella hordeovulneris]|nr:hypothetical protein [Buchananella hordeovulneris]
MCDVTSRELFDRSWESLAPVSEEKFEVLAASAPPPPQKSL